MKLTRSVGYAVGILLRVEQAGDGPMTAEAISRGCKFPPRFLYRVLRRLVDAGLLRGISGPRGGYSLALGPKQISLLDIVDAVDEGSNNGGLTPVARQQKPAIELINQVCEQNSQQMRAQLAKVSLARLAEACRPPKKQPRQRAAAKRSAATSSGRSRAGAASRRKR